ncbi:MAG: hypothetical protein ABR502_08720 [Chitinophagaceae bacterium]
MSDRDIKDIAFEFLMEEYKELNNSLHINEERGEKRLEFFITISSLVLGALGLFIMQFSSIPGKFQPLTYLLIILLLTGLVCIGFIVQRRLIKRNNITDGFKDDITRIRKIIQNLDSNHTIIPIDYTSFVDPKNVNGTTDKRKLTSLTHIAAVINFILAAAAAAFACVAFSLDAKRIIIVALTGALLFSILSFLMVKNVKKK